MRHAIYRLTFSNGKVYIGHTKDFAKRLSGHKSCARSGKNTILHKAWRKYGDPVGEVIFNCAKDDAAHFESFFVAEYKANCIEFGYNSTTGGEVSPMTFPDISAKVTASLKKWMGNPDNRAKMAASIKASMTPEVVARHCETLQRPDVKAKREAALKTPEAIANQRAGVLRPEVRKAKADATKSGWASGRFNSKCVHSCKVDGVPYQTVGQAFMALGLKYSASRRVRGRIIDEGFYVYFEGGKSYKFEIT